MQAWFSGSGPSPSSSSSAASSQPPSLLAEWNSYAAARSSSEDVGGGFGIDIEAAVRSANDSVAGTFGVVSKGVRGLPGSFQSSTSSVPSGKSLMYFGLFLASGIFLVFIAFTIFLPVMVIMPQKFAFCFTMGCAFIIGSFFALKGPKNQLYHMISREKLREASVLGNECHRKEQPPEPALCLVCLQYNSKMVVEVSQVDIGKLYAGRQLCSRIKMLWSSKGHSHSAQP